MFSAINWETTSKSGVDVTYYTGGPEAGTTTDIVYDQRGAEQLRIERETFRDFEFAFQYKKYDDYKVRLLIDGECYRDTETPMDKDYTIPEVTLKGVKLIKNLKNQLEKDFTLAKPEKVKCVLYGGTLFDPAIKIDQFDDENIKFTLPNNQKTTITKLKLEHYPNSSKFPEVEFE